MRTDYIVRHVQAKVADYISEHHLLQSGDRVLVALSGGADSVALLHVLRALNYDCTAAHCNFRLRGEESDRDQQFVEDLCHQWDVPLHLTHFDTTDYANRQQISMEMAARELRYQWFDDLLHRDKVADLLATGHHMDDQAETLLLRLMRGTGINGLRGMQPKRDSLIRPLLCLSAHEIKDYLTAIHQTYVTDSSNFDLSIARNKVRHTLIPLMEAFNPSVKQTMAEMMSQLNDVYDLYQHAVQTLLPQLTNGDALSLRMPDGRLTSQALLHEWLKPWAFNTAQVQDIYQAARRGQTGKQFVSSSGERVCIDRQILRHDRPNDRQTPDFELQYTIEPLTEHYIFEPDPQVAYLDADLVDSQRLTLRQWQEGDRFVPFGMKGSKTVSDFLTDMKVSLPDKQRQWLLCQDEKIIWVIGKRIDNRYRCTLKTRKIIKITLFFPINEQK